MGHVDPVVERLDEAGQVDVAGTWPAERGHALPEPKLESRGLDGLEALGHPPPTTVAGEDLGRDVGYSPQPHGEDDEIEILSHPQGLPAYLAAVPERLGVPSLLLQAFAILELPVLGTRRPAGETPYVDQGLVGAGADGSLDAELQSLDVGALAGKELVLRNKPQ